MNELRVDIGGSNRGFVIATEDTKRLAQKLNRDLGGSTPDTFKGAQMMRDQYGKVFDDLKGPQGIGGLLQQFAGGFGQAGQAVLQLATGPVGVLTVALTAAYEAGKMAWQAMKESFQLGRDARMLGMSTTGLRRLDQADIEQGFEPGEARGRLGKFANTVGKAEEGDKAAREVFKDMGVEISGKTMEQILNQVAEAFDRIQDPAKRAREAVVLFGRGGQEMIPILQQLKSSGGVAGALVSDEQTEAVLGNTWKKVHGFFARFWNDMKVLGKEGLSDVISGWTGEDVVDVAAPVKVGTPEDSPEAVKAKAAENKKAAAENIRAQKALKDETFLALAPHERVNALLQEQRNLKYEIESMGKSGVLDDEKKAKLAELQTEWLKRGVAIKTAMKESNRELTPEDLRKNQLQELRDLEASLAKEKAAAAVAEFKAVGMKAFLEKKYLADKLAGMNVHGTEDQQFPGEGDRAKYRTGQELDKTKDKNAAADFAATQAAAKVAATQAQIYELKKEMGKQPHASSEHIDSMSSAGLFQSRGAVMNPMLDIGREQLGELRLIRQAISGKKDAFQK